MRKMSNEELKKQQTAAEKAEAEAEADQAADAAGYKTADEEAAEDKYSGEKEETCEEAAADDEALNTKYLRLMADFQNYKRRTEKEGRTVRQLRHYGDESGNVFRHGHRHRDRPGVREVIRHDAGCITDSVLHIPPLCARGRSCAEG